ncbi:MAG: hypothetical protein ACYDC9_13080 [Dermatophilaceae bacterium]
MNLLSTWAKWLRRNDIGVRAWSTTQQLQALAGALERAAAIAALAEQTVRACGQAGPVLGTAAQSGGDLVSQYERLRHVLADIPVDEQYAPLAQEIATLLRCHQWLVHASLELAFAHNPDPRVEAIRLRLNGLGAPAQRTRRPGSTAGRHPHRSVPLACGLRANPGIRGGGRAEPRQPGTEPPVTSEGRLTRKRHARHGPG